MRVLIAGGGTAGHLYPGLSLAEELKKEIKNAKIVFVGVKGGLEEELVPKAGYKLLTLNLKGLKRKLSLEALASFFLLFPGFSRAYKIIRDFKPDVVVGMGGYASFPVVAIAALLRKPTLIHEQNAIPGLANRLLSKLVDVVALTYSETKEFLPSARRAVVTGNPIRAYILNHTKEEGLAYLEIENKRRTLLVMGGSRGAASINKAMVEAYEFFRNLSDLQIVHITGRSNFDEVLREINAVKEDGDKILYRLFPYLDDIGFCYAVADLVVARAGASTLAEVTAWGLPALLIPYPYATSNHQEKNARVLERRGAARVILDNELDGEVLYRNVKSLIYNSKALRTMGEKAREASNVKAAEELVRLIQRLGRRI